MKQLDNAYTVSQINRYIGHMFSEDFALSNITVKGEISNLKYHTSGHIYFTLKDTASQISGVMFAGSRAGLQFKLEDGMSVLCTGTIGVYERGGSYQIYAKSFKADGVGDLYVKFEELKKELQEMGMFDPMYKKPIPKYACKIGVVTAKTGAAVRDIIQIAKRRNPYIDITLYPALVQGDGAVESIIRGIKTLDMMGLDVIIVGRGGGSIEDLWAFNEKAVAQAIFDADTPVISAVGHETDTTIADFVADLRAPTPSAGAELAVFDFAKLQDDMSAYKATLDSVMLEHINDARQRVAMYKLKVNQHSPKFILNDYQKKEIIYSGKIKRLLQDKLSEYKTRYQSYEELSHIMKDKIREVKQQLKDYERFSDMMHQSLERARHKLMLHTEKLETVSPLRKLASGYGYVQAEDGHRLQSVSDVKAGSIVRTSLVDGSFTSEVISIKQGDVGKSTRK